MKFEAIYKYLHHQYKSNTRLKREYRCKLTGTHSKGGIGSGLPTSSQKYNSSPGPNCRSSAAHPQLTRPIGHLLIKVIETPVRDPASCDFSFVNHHFSQVFHFQINVVRRIEIANIFIYYFLARINFFHQIFSNLCRNIQTEHWIHMCMSQNLPL